jgi:hypothetical protein
MRRAILWVTSRQSFPPSNLVQRGHELWSPSKEGLRRLVPDGMTEAPLTANLPAQRKPRRLDVVA